MAKLKKAVNKNYICDTLSGPLRINEHNREYIDRFVAINYESLLVKFRKCNTVNSSAFDSVDILDETILSLYIDAELRFTNWEQANAYLTGKFTEKTIRVVCKKPVLDEEDIIEND